MPIVVRKSNEDEVVKKTAPVPVAHVDVDEPPDQTLPVYGRFNRDPRIGPECFEVISTDTLKSNRKQAKKHSEKQIAEIARSYERFGMNDPIEVDENYVIISGYGRYLAAKHLGMREVPVVRYSHLSAAEKRAYAIASNKTAEKSEWDNAVLVEDFAMFSTDEVDIDPRDLGFTTVEVDDISCSLGAEEGPDPADEIEAVEAQKIPITKPGEMWLLGDHVVLCADALQRDNYSTLLGFTRVHIVWADGPYNVRNQGYVSERQGVREFAMGHGEMSPPQFIEFQETICANILAHLEPGAVIYMCMDHRHILELRIAADRVFGRHKNMCVWAKPTAGMGSFYRSQYELIMVYAAPGRSTNNFGLGGNGRNRSNLWQFPGLNSFGRGRDETLAMHPTVKPVAMIADALRDCSHRGEIVLDPFGGSGTTLIAAERTGRHARLMEIDPLYCDVTVRRWQKLTGKAARLADTNETFDEVEARRGAGQEGGRT